MYIIFRQTFVSILYTKLNELWQINFAYKIYTKVCRNVEYILYTNILYTFCTNLQEVLIYTTKIMYTICIQNSYRMYIQIIACKMDLTFQHILTHLLCTS